MATQLKKRHWNYQKEAKIEFISSNDFSYYDNMLDTSVLLGAIPKRFENLKVMCDLVEQLIVDIDTVGYSNKKAYEFSKKRAAEYSEKFITERLGISDNITE